MKNFISITTLIGGATGARPAGMALNIKLIIYFKWTPDNIGRVIIGNQEIVIQETLNEIIMLLLPLHFVELEDTEGNTLIVNFSRVCSFGEKMSYTQIVLMDKYLPTDWLKVKNTQDQITNLLTF